MRQELANLEAKDLITSSTQLLSQLGHTRFILMALKQVLNPSLNECLLIAATMIFLLAVLELFALFLPIEFKINISCGCSDWMIGINELDYGL